MKKGLDMTQLLREMELEARMTYMDYHLTLLHNALESGDTSNIEFQKSQLSKISERLWELENLPPQAVVV